ncbi:hypothetical protein SGPA1_21602 [Streptomyces misionensis JCM 4497]
MGAVRREGCRRPHHGDRRRRLPGHRPGHPTPLRTRPGRPSGLERGTQPLTPQGPRPHRARLRPHEDLEDPPRLPSQRRRRPPRHARHRPPPQPHPRRATGQRCPSTSTL